MLRSLVLSSLFMIALSAGAQSPAPAPPTAMPGRQASQSAGQPGFNITAQSAAHPEAVAASEPVITIHGFCPDTSEKTGDACATILTKEQFEKIIAAVNQNGAPMPAVAIRNLAERYVQMLAFADAAEKLGLDKDPKFQELMHVVRLNSLAEAYRRTQDEKFRSSSDDDVKAYYDKNTSRFEQIKLSRIFVPRVNPKAPHEELDDFAQRAQQVANAIRERAAKGEELDKLQQEAYKTLGLNPPSLNTDVGSKRRGSFPPAIEQELFALKPGEVSKVEPEPAGFQFYKLQGRETLTLTQAKNEIVAIIHKEQVDSANKGVMGSIHTDLNDTYFGPKSAGNPLLAPPARPPQARPAGPAAAPPDASGPAATAAPASKGSAPPK
jgi:parvulin-like peptidyl-prolyl isomerase